MAEVPAPARRLLRFSSFELDLQSGELRKAGVLVGLQEQSFKVLAELLDRPGDLITRDQLRQLLWPNGTFVDFEHGVLMSRYTAPARLITVLPAAASCGTAARGYERTQSNHQQSHRRWFRHSGVLHRQAECEVKVGPHEPR